MNDLLEDNSNIRDLILVRTISTSRTRRRRRRRRKEEEKEEKEREKEKKAHFKRVPPAADAELLVVGQAADGDGVCVVVASIHGKLTFDLGGVKYPLHCQNMNIQREKKYRFLEPLHGISQHLVIEPIHFPQLGPEKLGEPHVEKSRATKGTCAGSCFLDFKNRLEAGDGIRDEIHSTTAGIAYDEAVSRLVKVEHQ